MTEEKGVGILGDWDWCSFFWRGRCWEKIWIWGTHDATATGSCA